MRPTPCILRTPIIASEPEGSDQYMINVIPGRGFRKNDVEVVYAQSDVFKRNTGNYRIGYTMLETDHIPKEWADAARL